MPLRYTLGNGSSSQARRKIAFRGHTDRPHRRCPHHLFRGKVPAYKPFVSVSQRQDDHPRLFDCVPLENVKWIHRRDADCVCFVSECEARQQRCKLLRRCVIRHFGNGHKLRVVRALFDFRPETADPPCELADVLLHQSGSLPLADRELIATYVSSLNDCYYCQTAHGAIAAYHLNGDDDLVLQVKRDFKAAPISDKLKALLAIAGKVQTGAGLVTKSNLK
jgi:uncharacterized peroxidase-related enzyme